MYRTDLTEFDIKPRGMLNYLRYNGPHFSRELCSFAVGKMWKRGEGDRALKIKPWSKDEVDALLEKADVSVENDVLWDATFVANMCKADYLGSSIEDETHVAKFIKDVLDDPDGYDGIVFNRFLADCARKGVVIPWESVV